MTPVTDGHTEEEIVPTNPPTEPIEFIETYETDDGVVFYNVDNPLAWLESSDTQSLEEFR